MRKVSSQVVEAVSVTKCRAADSNRVAGTDQGQSPQSPDSAYFNRWQPGQKNVERWACTMRCTGTSRQVGHGWLSRE